MATEIDQLIVALRDAWNAHDVATITSFFAQDCDAADVAHPAPLQGRRGMSRFADTYLRAFPDLVVSLHDVVIQGDRAAVSWTVSGTHQGTLINVPATGRQIGIQGGSFLTFRSGQIVTCYCVWDLAGFLRAIRLLPELSG